MANLSGVISTIEPFNFPYSITADIISFFDYQLVQLVLLKFTSGRLCCCTLGMVELFVFSHGDSVDCELP